MVCYLLTGGRLQGPPPVICIDDAHVLMDWDKSDPSHRPDWEVQTDLTALLYFFIQVRILLAAAHHCLVITMSLGMQSSIGHADKCEEAPSPCHLGIV